MPKIISLSIDENRFPDFARWVDEQDHGKRSEAICTAMTTWLTGDIRLIDVYKEVKELRESLESGAIVNNPASQTDEPEDIANLLDNFGL